jgi:hypothetical protein
MPKKGVTLEQLRNLQNPKFLFSKEDEASLQELLGLNDASPTKDSQRRLPEIRIAPTNKASVRENPDYLDNKSVEYHRKVINRAQQIEALERKRQPPAKYK